MTEEERVPAPPPFSTRLLVFLLTLALLGAAAASLWRSGLARRSHMELAQARITGNASSMAEQLSARLRVIDASLSTLVNSLQAQDMLPSGPPDELPGEVTEVLNKHLLEHSLSYAPQVLEFVILDADGSLLASSAPWATHIGKDMLTNDNALEDFYDEAVSILPFRLKNRPGNYLLYCRLLPGAPSISHYMAAAVLAVGQLTPQMPASSLTDHMTSSLLDSRNHILASWPQNTPSHYAALLERTENASQAPRSAISPWQFAVDAEDMLVVVSDIRFFPLFLVSAVGNDIVLADWRADIRRDSLLFIAAAILVLVSGIALSRALWRGNRAERILRRQRQRYRALVEHFPTGAIMLFDASMRCVLASGLGLPGLGADPAGLEGHLPSQALPGDAGRRLERNLKKALNGARLSFTLLLSEHTFEVFLTPLHESSPPEGPPDHCIAVFNDITQRDLSRQALRQSETRYRTLARNMPDGLAFLFDKKLRLLLADGRSMAEFGVSPNVSGLLADDATLPAVLPAEIAARLTPLCAAALEGRSASQELPVGERVFEVNAEPIDNGRGVISQGLLVARDISARKRFEEALLQARDAAEAANRMKSGFVATISHEIRTPITGILGMVEAALSRTTDAPQRRFLEKIRNVAKNLSNLINDLLDFSRMEAGKLPLAPRPCHLRSLVENALEPLCLVAREKGLALSVQAAPDLPEHIMADPVRLNQVLLNLAGNAVKFTEHGWVRLSVEPASTDGVSPPALLFTVEDSGPGIAEDAQQRVFESFTQADMDDGYTREHSGSGLGLAISRQLVELWEGRIGLTSTPGKGSVFWFTLPLLPLPPGWQPGEARPADDAAKRTLHILLAEDNELISEFLTLFLEEQGHRVSSATDGIEALQTLEDAQKQGDGVDLVIMDVQMRRMSGPEATRSLRCSGTPYAHVPVIGLTAYALAGDTSYFLNSGMNEVLAKPVSREDLLAAVERYAPAAEKA